jgi:oligopeptidase B
VAAAKEDPRVLAYLNEENAYTDAVLKPTEELQERLYQEMLGRILQTDLSVPYRLRGYSYYSRTEEGKQYPIYCRIAEPEAGQPTEAEDRHFEEEDVLLDLNALAEGHSFLGLGCFEVSDDNQRLAYATDTTGFRQYTLEVRISIRERFPSSSACDQCGVVVGQPNVFLCCGRRDNETLAPALPPCMGFGRS